MFNIGQRVVCVKDSGTNLVKRGKIYIVYRFGPSPKLGLPMVWLDELSGMYASRFRPIVERKTDISIFTKMLTDNKESVQ